MAAPVNPYELTVEHGVFLVKLARRAVEERIAHGRIIEPPEDTPEIMRRPGMVFVTIEKALGDRRELRGCIGFLAPVYSLVKATIKAALEAALNDPRFPPVSPEELQSLVYEVSVLSEPYEPDISDRRELPGKIIIGRHGLVASRGWFTGTLLPSVPVEYCWDPETFLAETCLKAGLPPECWLSPDVSIKLYDGRVFAEKEPRGPVVERDLHREYREKCLGGR